MVWQTHDSPCSLSVLEICRRQTVCYGTNVDGYYRRGYGSYIIVTQLKLTRLGYSISIQICQWPLHWSNASIIFFVKVNRRHPHSFHQQFLTCTSKLLAFVSTRQIKAVLSGLNEGRVHLWYVTSRRRLTNKLTLLEILFRLMVKPSSRQTVLLSNLPRYWKLNAATRSNVAHEHQ